MNKIKDFLQNKISGSGLIIGEGLKFTKIMGIDEGNILNGTRIKIKIPSSQGKETTTRSRQILSGQQKLNLLLSQEENERKNLSKSENIRMSSVRELFSVYVLIRDDSI